MKVELWSIGKTNETYLKEGIRKYSERLRHYTSFSYVEWDDVKNASKMRAKQLKAAEAKMILSKLTDNSYLVLLDEKGKEFGSLGFSGFIQNHLNYSSKNLVFLIGGAYGFDATLYQKADLKLSLSKMTFSHQMIRLFFTEQLYRAFTILRNEKYHNQ